MEEPYVLDDTLVVTCPNCTHTHQVRLEEGDLDRLRKNSADDRLYKLHEVENILGLSRRTLKQLIYDGKLEAEKLGDAANSPWMVSAAAITAYRRSRGQM